MFSLFFMFNAPKNISGFQDILERWFRNPVNSPVEVGSLFIPLFTRLILYIYISGGEPDFFPSTAFWGDYMVLWPGE